MGHDITPDLQLYTFEGRRVRTLPATADRPELFAAPDLCALLDHSDPSKAVRDHLEADEWVRVSLVSAGRTDSDFDLDWQGEGRLRGLQPGPRTVLMVTEPGAWALVMESRAPNARAVRSWLARDVLPALRRTGVYAVPDVARELADTLAGARAVLDFLGTEDAVDTEIAARRDGPAEIDDTAVGRAAMVNDARVNADRALERIAPSLPEGYVPAVPPQLPELTRRLAERARALPKAMRHAPRALGSDARTVDPWPPLPDWDQQDGPPDAS